MQPNPLLEMNGLPPFQAIRPEHIEPAIDAVLAENRAAIAALLEQDEYTWASLIRPLESLDDRLNRIWSPVGHMNAVINSPELRAAYNACLPKLSAYATELGQNEALFRALQSIRDGAEHATLDTAQRKLLDNSLRDFRLSGVALPADQKARFKALSEQLSQLTARFDENLLDATHGWHKDIADAAQLTGLPDSSKAVATQAAEQAGESGWRLTLDFPCYYAVLTYADERPLRRELYEAYATRASDQGPQAGQWDNGPVMEQILCPAPRTGAAARFQQSRRVFARHQDGRNAAAGTRFPARPGRPLACPGAQRTR